MFRFVLLVLGATLLTACESGHVVEFRITAPTTTTPDSEIIRIFEEVSEACGRAVYGPLDDLGSDVRYVASPNSQSAPRNFDMFAIFSRSRGIFIRTFNSNAAPDWAAVPFREIETRLKSAGISYKVREN